jgi:uncharacterized integral membrane protein
MPMRTVLLLVILALLAAFVIANWAAFTTPTTLSVLVGSVQAPLGLVMLTITAALALVFLIYAFYLQTSVLLETRRMTREVQAQRQLADQAEASRFTELRGHLDQAVNTLAAQIAELDDRMAGRGGAPRS